jgi:uncharacterized repeat protein (TIGR01451 family)
MTGEMRRWLCTLGWLGLVAALWVPQGATASPGSPRPATALTNHRQVNLWPASGPVASSWGSSAIFWFGQASDTTAYVDVRLAYDSQNLYVQATVVDYYLWYDPTGTADPRQYDAFAVYLDTNGDGEAAPQADDYFLVSGFRNNVTGSVAPWQRQGRGVNGAWDETWTPTPAWSDSVYGRWYNSGPNNNSDRDAGWVTTITVPWATLGQSGPPAAGTAWGLGTEIYNRNDQPPAGEEPIENWPETFSETAPATWGTLVFNPPAFTPAPAVATGTMQIRQGLNGTASDAYVGGGGTCSGGIYGGGDTPHPGDNLFVQNEADVSDFPCFSKSYIQFDLSALPAGQSIISATLTVYEFGGSDPSAAQPSDIQLFAVSDPWDANTITWDNAPLAAENLTGTIVNPVLVFPGWPGVPYVWDATQLVSQAYSSGQEANLVLYSSDVNYNSGKYFVSSSTGDWNATGRPTLTITYGTPVPALTNVVSPTFADQGATLTYTLGVTGSGQPLQLVDPLPAGVTYVPGSATAGASYDAGSNAIAWSGTPPAGQVTTITYAVTVSTGQATLVTSTATLTGGQGGPVTALAQAIVNGYATSLPVVK